MQQIDPSYSNPVYLKAQNGIKEFNEQPQAVQDPMELLGLAFSVYSNPEISQDAKDKLHNAMQSIVLDPGSKSLDEMNYLIIAKKV